MTYGRPTKLYLRKIVNGKVETDDVPFNTRSEAIDQIPFYQAMDDVEQVLIENEGRLP